MGKNKKHHRSQVTQVPIYLGKFFRMFLFMDDWKVIPMAAIIAGVVSFVTSKTIFVSMEGTLKGALAIACLGVWNGCFNSIQVVCRERGIIKREHRSGMHISSYIFSHMVYQGFLCLLQSIVTIVVFQIGGMKFPEKGLATPWFILDLTISVFLITFAADMLSLLLSCIARTTTAAMTLMPFLLIFELVFSGSMFEMTGVAQKLTNLSIAKWGIQSICAEADYNSLPMTMAWTQLKKFKDVEYMGEQPIKLIIEHMEEDDMVDDFCLQCGQSNQNENYVYTVDNLKECWFYLIIMSLLEAACAILVLGRIDKDKR